MPHCTVEYSANLVDDPNWSEILLKIHDKFIATGQFVAADIKSRVVRQENYLIGRGEADQSFVTLHLQMLDGRSDAIKNELSGMALDVLIAAFPRSLAEQKCSITVQVSDIHRPSYQRHVSG
jgi:5-carboxymethyl-2-hydroxymuconate isomerase